MSFQKDKFTKVSFLPGHNKYCLASLQEFQGLFAFGFASSNLPFASPLLSRISSNNASLRVGAEYWQKINIFEISSILNSFKHRR